MNSRLTIASLRRSLIDSANPSEPIRTTLHGQITELESKMTKAQKPYWRFTFADGSDAMEINVWNDHAAYPVFHPQSVKNFVGIDGTFRLGEYGLEAVKWNLFPLSEQGIEDLLGGSSEQETLQFASVTGFVEGMDDPALRMLCLRFLETHGAQFRRAAGARKNHHARRGGLLAHTASMMCAAKAISAAYPQINRDLLLAGTLFHDAGKMVENQYEARGFAMPYTTKAELFGHISIGVEIVRTLWREIISALPVAVPAAEHVINCLCHLVLSHHGELSYGSPVEPKLPEAALLHYLDQIDAKLEMFEQSYATAQQIGEGVFEKSWPLKVNLVRGVAKK